MIRAATPYHLIAPLTELLPSRQKLLNYFGSFLYFYLWLNQRRSTVENYLRAMRAGLNIPGQRSDRYSGPTGSSSWQRLLPRVRLSDLVLALWLVFASAVSFFTLSSSA